MGRSHILKVLSKSKLTQDRHHAHEPGQVKGHVGNRIGDRTGPARAESQNASPQLWPQAMLTNIESMHAQSQSEMKATKVNDMKTMGLQLGFAELLLLTAVVLNAGIENEKEYDDCKVFEYVNDFTKEKMVLMRCKHQGDNKLANLVFMSGRFNKLELSDIFDLKYSCVSESEQKIMRSETLDKSDEELHNYAIEILDELKEQELYIGLYHDSRPAEEEDLVSLVELVASMFSSTHGQITLEWKFDDADIQSGVWRQGGMSNPLFVKCSFSESDSTRQFLEQFEKSDKFVLRDPQFGGLTNEGTAFSLSKFAEAIEDFRNRLKTKELSTEEVVD